jgi:hypothetical protein
VAKLSIDLQDGFADDTVVVSVDGREVLRRAGVRTRRTLGLAESLSVDVDGPPITLEVSLPLRGIADATRVDPAAAGHVGVSLVDGRIRYRLSHRPFGYA